MVVGGSRRSEAASAHVAVASSVRSSSPVPASLVRPVNDHHRRIHHLLILASPAMLVPPMMRTARIGSLPVSLRHFLRELTSSASIPLPSEVTTPTDLACRDRAVPATSFRSLHCSPSRGNPVMKDLLRAASTEKELREAVEVVGEWMATGRSQERWDTAPDMLDIIVGEWDIWIRNTLLVVYC